MRAYRGGFKPLGLRGTECCRHRQTCAKPVPAHFCSLACGVYLMHSLPAILFPSGMLASVLTLLAGVLLGLAVAAGGLVSRGQAVRLCDAGTASSAVSVFCR